jgi:two-component system, NtrC family, sensor kinase
MKLARKFALTLTCAILAVFSVTSIIDVRRELALFDAETRRDNHSLGRALAVAASTSWTVRGEAEARKIVEEAGDGVDVAVRFVLLDAELDSADAPAVPRDLLAPLAEGHEAFVRWQPPEDDDPSIYTYVPLSAPGARAAAIEVRESLADEESYVLLTVLQAILATAALVLLCGLLAVGLGVLFVGRPVRRLVEHARRIGAGDLSKRLPVSRADEIGELAAEMNSMCERLEVARDRVEAETRARLATLDQLRHADRLTTIGRLASGIAHELGTPLNVITGHAQLITEESSPESPAYQNAAIVSQQAQRVTRIMRQLLDFARRRTPQKYSHDVLTIAEQATALLAPLALRSRIRLEIHHPRSQFHGSMDPEHMQQALMNLIMNAIQAMPDGGIVTIRLDRALAKPPSSPHGAEAAYVRIEIRDTGEGIPADVLPRIFEPFVTTKEPGVGTGLGLSIASGIVAEHGGWIDVKSEAEKGSRFFVYLPLEEAPA